MFASKKNRAESFDLLIENRHFRIHAVCKGRECSMRGNTAIGQQNVL